MTLSDCVIDLNGVFFRFNTPRWAFQPLSGAGAAKWGGRFNRPGLTALYLGKELATAAAEYQQAESVLLPATVASYEINHLSVVDFSAGFDPERWEPLWAEHACNYRGMAYDQHIEPPSWVLGDLVNESPSDGLLYPSTKAQGGTCLVIFQPELIPSRNLRVIDLKNQLPRDQSAWGPEGS